ncbi:MAG: heat-inducible transcriptional repressor HrcA [Actinobacteria bacterium]|nr:heat-inducible transcriptional repressor HrcA [Actinomycetota bacterium]
MLDDRKSAILRAVVEEYIATADPVGSARVARASEVAVSPATVRNEMAVLEREGYLIQPHTSAGRIPTDKGYRYFVDQLSGPASLDPSKRHQVRQFFAKAHGELEQMLADTSQLLSGLTDYAAVVLGPSHDVAVVRSVQVVGLAPRVGLVVAVLSNGVVERRQVDFDEDVSDDRLTRISAHLSATLVGHTFADSQETRSMGESKDDSIAKLAMSALLGGQDADSDHVFVGGVSRMAQAFEAVDTVRRVLRTLEQQYVVVGLLRDLMDRGVSVAIGAEHGVQQLAECSIVVAPYDVEGEQLGTIGVLGPTRMHYPEALSAVAVVSRRLGERLSAGSPPETPAASR